MPKTFIDRSIDALCETSDFESAMAAYYQLVRAIMPIDGVFLNTFLDELQTVKFIYTVGNSTTNLCGTKIDVPAELAAKMQDPNRPNIRLVNNLHDEAVTSYVMPRSLPKVKSMMYFILYLEGEYLGILSFYSHHADKFKSQQSQVIATVVPIISNLLKRHLTETGLTQENLRLKLERRQYNMTNHLSQKIVGYYTGLKETMQKAELIAPHHKHVLICGETGVGKRMVANAIHMLSGKPSQKLQYIDCKSLKYSDFNNSDSHHYAPAINQMLADSDTTLVLDNCSHLGEELQGRLSYLYRHQPIDAGPNRQARVIFLTNQSRAELLQSSSVANVINEMAPYHISVPPLRERKQDIQRLAEHFVDHHQRCYQTSLAPQVVTTQLDKWRDYHWPGNLVELTNHLEQLVLDGHSDHQLGAVESSSTVPTVANASSELACLDEVIINHLSAALTQANGVIHGPSGAAKLIGLNPNTFRSKLRKYQLM